MPASAVASSASIAVPHATICGSVYSGGAVRNASIDFSSRFGIDCANREAESTITGRLRRLVSNRKVFALGYCFVKFTILSTVDPRH